MRLMLCRCPQAQAYEKRRDSNGIYMKHLSRHITENMRIEHILEHVNKGTIKLSLIFVTKQDFN